MSLILIVIINNSAALIIATWSMVMAVIQQIMRVRIGEQIKLPLCVQSSCVTQM